MREWYPPGQGGAVGRRKGEETPARAAASPPVVTDPSLRPPYGLAFFFIPNSGSSGRNGINNNPGKHATITHKKNQL